ncbi:MAG: hypothetical protein KGQ59_03240 [Bdellovibrionales bacterium]|nr:hypothetical protein [Bdellovibrionales bacterium]
MRKSSSSLIWFVGAAGVFWSCAHPTPLSLATEGRCPMAELGETESDCPWALWVRNFSSLPGSIVQSLELDAKDPALHEAWGLSLNFDAGARAEIVSRPILQALAREFRTDLTEVDGVTHQHAGLIHTYGYLLSNLRTPFGYKRARWVSGTVDRGLGLPAETLGPAVRGSSTLLSRATYLFLKVALHQDPGAWKAWRRRLLERATPELDGLSLPKISRKIERYPLQSGGFADLITDLVPLERDPAGRRLLVYSVRRAGRVQLITGFPVEASFEERPGNPVRPRYNAWLE